MAKITEMCVCGDRARPDKQPTSACPACWTRYAKANPASLAGLVLLTMEGVPEQIAVLGETAFIKSPAKFTSRETGALLVVMTALSNHPRQVMSGQN